MHHSFDISIAKKFGINQAVFLNNLAFWIQKNVANRVHFHEENFWTYNSHPAFLIIFPYWSIQTLKTTIASCSSNELILINNFNERKYDKTSWYAFTENGLNLFPCLKNDLILAVNEKKSNTIIIGGNQPVHRLKSTCPSVEINRPIPDSYPDIKTDKREPETQKPARRKHAPLSVDFVFDELNSQACIAKGLNIDHVLSKFKAHMASTGKKSADWQAEARLWIERERVASTQNSVKKQIPEGEIRSTVPEIGPGHPTWETRTITDKKQWFTRKGWTIEEQEEYFKNEVMAHGSDKSRDHVSGTGVRQVEAYLL